MGSTASEAGGISLYSTARWGVLPQFLPLALQTDGRFVKGGLTRDRVSVSIVLYLNVIYYHLWGEGMRWWSARSAKRLVFGLGLETTGPW